MKRSNKEIQTKNTSNGTPVFNPWELVDDRHDIVQITTQVYNTDKENEEKSIKRLVASGISQQCAQANIRSGETVLDSQAVKPKIPRFVFASGDRRITIYRKNKKSHFRADNAQIVRLLEIIWCVAVSGRIEEFSISNVGEKVYTSNNPGVDESALTLYILEEYHAIKPYGDLCIQALRMGNSSARECILANRTLDALIAERYPT